MQSWQSSFLGLRGIPRDLSAFELNAFFTFDAAERRCQCAQLVRSALIF
jgi:hypothetical protein